MASGHYTLISYVTLQPSMEKVVTCEAWAEAVGRLPRDGKEAASEVKSVVCNDRQLRKAKALRDVTGPGMELVRFFDRQEPNLGWVYSKWCEMDNKIVAAYNESESSTAISQPQLEAVRTIYRERHTYAHADIFAAAHALNPANIAVSPADLGQEVMTGLNTCLQRFYHGNAQNQQTAFTEFMTWKNPMSAPRKFTSNLPLCMGIF